VAVIIQHERHFFPCQQVEEIAALLQELPFSHGRGVLKPECCGAVDDDVRVGHGNNKLVDNKNMNHVLIARKIARNIYTPAYNDCLIIFFYSLQ